MHSIVFVFFDFPLVCVGVFYNMQSLYTIANIPIVFIVIVVNNGKQDRSSSHFCRLKSRPPFCGGFSVRVAALILLFLFLCLCFFFCLCFMFLDSFSGLFGRDRFFPGLFRGRNRFLGVLHDF